MVLVVVVVVVTAAPGSTTTTKYILVVHKHVLLANLIEDVFRAVSNSVRGHRGTDKETTMVKLGNGR